MNTNNGTNVNRYPYRATFARLPSGEWGCLVTGTAPAVGEPVTVLRKGGGGVRKALGPLVRADATRGDLYEIADLAAAPAPAPVVEAPAPVVAGVDAWTRGALAALRSRLDVTEARLESVESSLDAAEQTIAAQGRALDVALRALETARDLLDGRARLAMGERDAIAAEIAFVAETSAPAPVPTLADMLDDAAPVEAPPPAPVAFYWPEPAPLAERPVTGRATRTRKGRKPAAPKPAPDTSTEALLGDLFGDE